MDDELGRVRHDGETVVVERKVYGNGRTAIVATSLQSGPYSTVSVNAYNSDFIPESGEFVVSNDIGALRGFEAVLLASGLFEDTGKRASYGYVKDRPVWRVATPEQAAAREAAGDRPRKAREVKT